MRVQEQKSIGHLLFTTDGQREYFDRDGEVYIAPVSSPVMTDGYRIGRWEISRRQFDYYRQFQLYRESRGIA